MKQDNSNILNWKYSRTVLIALGFTALLGACDTTHQVASTEPSGFMGDYSQLQKGDSDEALLLYINPNADFKKYDKILFEPIELYTEPKSNLAELPKEDVQVLMNYLDATIREQLSSDYIFVTESGPRVMRLRGAITEAKGSKVLQDTLSSILPYAFTLSVISKVTTGTHIGVGMARIEGELIDSVTGELLFAAVDERAGRKYTGRFDKWKKWQDTKDAYDYWAKGLKKRLTELKDIDSTSKIMQP